MSARPPTPVRLAGALIVVEGLGGVGFGGYLGLRATAALAGGGSMLGAAGMFVLFGALMMAVGVGLVRGRFWARTPGIVIQALLLPAVFALLGPRQVLAAALTGVLVLAALILLLSDRARRWALDLDDARRQR